MAFDYINEAFKKLDILDEAMFNSSLDGINQLSDFIDQDDNTDDVVRVIDPEADTEADIQDSYIGKVIINCNVCHSHIFENKDDVTIGEEGVVNLDMQCPYCGEQEGFTIIGEIAPYGNETQESEDMTQMPVEEQPTEETENTEMTEALGIGAGLALGGAAIGAGKLISNLMDSVESEEDDKEDLNENKPLSMSRASRRAMQEDFKEVSVTTDDQHMQMTSDENGKVTVTTEPVNNSEESNPETIVPVSDETEQEILDNNNVEDNPDDELDIDFDEVDEDSFDELGESYLKEVYDNVESFKTTSVAKNSTSLVVEGVIRFNSGVSKKTGFIFESKDANDRGQLRFSGHNNHLAESASAFNLVGRVHNNKLIAESLKYNYTVNNEPVRGLVRRK